MNKRREAGGQMQISFGMIFSIILIIVFIVFAIYGITKFLCISKIAQVEKFKSDFQEDIDSMWKSTQGSERVEYFIPKKIEQVCFKNRINPKTLKDENMYFVPEKFSCDISTAYILDNVDIAKTVAGLTGRKLCIDNSNGKISMTIKKAFNENLVTITK